MIIQTKDTHRTESVDSDIIFKISHDKATSQLLKCT